MIETSISAIIIDDEQLARQLIRTYLQDHPQIKVVAECENGFEGFKAIGEFKPDLLFLDVKMPKITGFEMLELIDGHPTVIFSTAYDEFAIKAFESNAADYLLKPYSQSRFNEALTKAKERIASAEKQRQPIEEMSEQMQAESLQRVVVRLGNRIQIIDVADITYIEAQDDYVELHTDSGSFLKQKTMKYYEKHLQTQEFARVHRSYIVAVRQIQKLEPYGKDTHVAILKNGKQLNVSRSGYHRLKNVLKF